MKFPRPARFLALALALGVLGFAAVSGYYAWDLTSPPRKSVAAADAEKYFSKYENVRFNARDGVSLAGWFVPREGARQAVVLLHGSGSSRKQMMARAKLLH